MPASAPTEARHVVVVGAGIGGLGTALALSRNGHRVTLVERDATPLPHDPDAAFDWDRRGAPQVRHSHALLARLRNLLRDDFPDVLHDLLAAGATEMRFAEMFPEGIDDPSPLPDDDDLVALACRRTTFEWVLRRSVLADPLVTLLDGAVAQRLVVEPGIGEPGSGEVPHVAGVHITTPDDPDGRPILADLVVAAGGRRSSAVRWLHDIGVEVEVAEEDTGIVYLSRFYRLHAGAAPPRQEGPIGGDLGYLKYAVFQGDNRTYSVTFAVRTHDDELRSKLLQPAYFDAAAAALPATERWADPAIAKATTDVHVMAGLLNRHIRFVDASGEPLVRGFVAVGDAHTCTNPLYGRGCSLALVQATLLSDALATHPDDLDALARAYETGSAREIEPWYRAAVDQDRMTRDAVQARKARAEGGDDSAASPAAADPAREGAGAAADPDAGYADPQKFVQGLLVDGVLPAARRHAAVFRAFVRVFNLLDPPDAMFGNPEVLGHVLAVYQSRDTREPEPPLGPPRAEMLALLAAAGASA